MEEITIRDSAAEQLKDAKRQGETLSETVERLAGGTDADPSGISQLSSSRERLDEEPCEVWMFTPDILADAPTDEPDELDDRARP